MDTVFVEETEVCERSIRRLADSRDCAVERTGNTYQILGAGVYGVTFSDDEVWDYLAQMPQVRNLHGHR